MRTGKFTRRLLKVRSRLVVATAFISLTAFAQEIDWYSVDNGGGISSFGDIQLIGVIGQIDTVRMTGGDISLSGGYLPLPPAGEIIFENGFE